MPMEAISRFFLMAVIMGSIWGCTENTPFIQQDGRIVDSDDTQQAESDPASDTTDTDTVEPNTDSPEGYDFDHDYTPHAPIVIDGNDEFRAAAAAEGWPGDGSEENPYLIEGYDIDLNNGKGGAVDVSNTDVHFVVRKCFLHGGIHRLGSSYGYGVLTRNVSNMRVEQTVATDNFEGVRLEKGTTNCIIHYNDLSQNAGHGVALASAHNNIIEYNLCADEKDDGILFGTFDVADNFDAPNNNIIRFNEFSGNSTSGVCLFRGRGNQFYGNLFGKGNGVPVLNTAGQNTWDNEEQKIGNWWVSFSGPDADGDGIIDTEKKIPGGGVDRYPLAERPRTTPH